MGELEEVAHSAGPTAELDDVAALHRGRRNLDVGNQRAAGRPFDHCFTSTDEDLPDAEWQAQSHAS
ncbi:hypothetical protein [Streptomyces sp. NPDC057413]|uniref:hypothetical protein n=1 Tax=Streptomyces sp. NPDC057413 TaxID=3346124 RepID=UPI003693D98E